MIVLRFVTEEGELEAVLPFRLPMASSAVAAVAAEDRHDLIGKADWDDIPGALHLDAAADGSFLVSGRDTGFSIAGYPDQPMV